jgi:cytochrome c
MRRAFARALGLMAFAATAAAAPAQGDSAAGAVVYERCAACHALAYDRTGPRHCGVVGRPRRKRRGFRVLRGDAALGIVWTRETLDRFLPIRYARCRGRRWATPVSPKRRNAPT